ncbi:MAG: lysophospholipase [Planctomycetes bacterium]|nr:lysophospholipase [Planctomycetota bacterium]
MSSTQPRIEFYNAADGRRLAVRVWRTNESPRAQVVFLHGISSHGGWYVRGNESLAGAGFQVHFLDRRGSGLNTEDRGDVDHWQTWIDDVAIYLEQLGESQSKPVVLCGISWGGKLAVAVARRHPELTGALGLICPGLYSPFEPGIVKRLALAAPVTTRVQRRRVAIPLRDPELFTDNPPWRAFIASDPLTLREITWRFAREDRELSRYARESAPFLTQPLLLMLAGRDRIIDNRRVRDFFARVASENKSLIEYPSAAHTLEFEPDPQPYFNDLANWIGQTAVAKQ